MAPNHKPRATASSRGGVGRKPEAKRDSRNTWRLGDRALRVEGGAVRASRQGTAKPDAIKGPQRRRGGCARKVAGLIRGGLPGCRPREVDPPDTDGREAAGQPAGVSRGRSSGGIVRREGPNAKPRPCAAGPVRGGRAAPREQEWHPLARRAAAAIALGRRELRLAEELARLCFEGAADDDLARGPALELLVAVQLGRGDEQGARSTLDQLAALAASCGNPSLEASAELAAGRVAIAQGDDEAIGHLKRAVELFAGRDLPFETARARLELARALAPSGPDAAAYEARLALDAFERLGGAYDCDAAAARNRTYRSRSACSSCSK
jgi:hypothetical protein